MLSLGLSVGAAEAFFADQELKSSVATNGTKVLKRYYLYALGPCRGLPRPQWTYEGAKLGKVISETGSTKISNGPCGPDFEYPFLQLSYTAGSEAGRDSFKIYVHNGHLFTPIPVTVSVGNTKSERGTLPKPQSNQVKQSIPSEPKSLAKAPSTPAEPMRTWLLALSITGGVNCEGFSKPLALKTNTRGQLVGSFSLNNAVWRLEGVLVRDASFDIKAVSTAQTIAVVGISDKGIGKGVWKSGSCSGTAVLAEQ